jgi:NAD(P)-dependent dehydrogenase (short-subunit alcohol dehydrogenase family)
MLEGRVAVITGAGRGLGAAIADELAAQGASVVIADRDEDVARATAEGLRAAGRVATPRVVDVSDAQQVAELFDAVAAEHGRLDVLVNNAGVGVAGAAEESSIEQARALFETNVFGAIRMTRAVLPHMREQGSGRIINVSSVLGFLPAPFMALYAATKHAIEGYSESLDHEVRDHGVRVLLVEPGYTRTSFDANAVAVDEPLALYARRREASDVLTAAAVKAGDEPAVVGEAIVAAATDTHPKLRYPAGTLARRVSKLRRYVPSALFDRQIRKTNQLAA